MTEAEALVLIAFTILSLALTLAAFALKSGRGILSFAAAGSWILLGVYNYTHSATTWDIHYSLFWLSMGMTIACALIPAILREKRETEASVDDIDELDKPLLDDIEAGIKDRERFRRLMGTPRRKVKPSRYSKTGEI